MSTILRLWLSLGLLLTCVGLASSQELQAPTILAAIEGRITRAIGQAEPSVVAIARVKKDLAGEPFQFESRPDPFGGQLFGSAAPKPTDADYIPTDFATGVVVDPDGLILTAYHALSDNSDYFVTTVDRKRYQAWVKAADPRSDLAVLSINATGLQPIQLGDASKLRKGQFVIALGNPYAIARDGQASASWGIVANMARKTPPLPGLNKAASKSTLHHYGTLIQTDAKLNLGTSGGPLLDLQGRMVGLCVSLAALSGFEQSAGYAIPVDDTFRRAISTLKQGREVEYGFLGITPGSLTREETLQGLHGCRVDRVWAGTPADRYGIRNGDIVTAIDQKPIFDTDGLMLEVGRQPAGANVELSVFRYGHRFEADVALTKYRVRGEKTVSQAEPAWRGLEVDYPTAMVDPDEWGSLETPLVNYDDGVIVTRVEENSPAWEAGLRPKHVISHVGGTKVSSPSQFRSAVAEESGPVGFRLTAPYGESRVLTVPPNA